jgi:hypothetical protein
MRYLKGLRGMNIQNHFTRTRNASRWRLVGKVSRPDRKIPAIQDSTNITHLWAPTHSPRSWGRSNLDSPLNCRLLQEDRRGKSREEEAINCCRDQWQLEPTKKWTGAHSRCGWCWDLTSRRLQDHSKGKWIRMGNYQGSSSGMAMEALSLMMKRWEENQTLRLYSPARTQNGEGDSRIPLKCKAYMWRKSRQKGAWPLLLWYSKGGKIAVVWTGEVNSKEKDAGHLAKWYEAVPN